MANIQPNFLGGDYHKKGTPSLVDTTPKYHDFARRGEQMQTPVLVTVNRAVQTILNLRDTDPERFVKIAEQLSVEAKPLATTLTGENHPLAAMLNTPFDDPGFDSLMEGVEEYRRRQEEL